MSSKKPNITEVVLRDGQQSLIATRMKTEDMLPVLSKLDKVGYSSLEAVSYTHLTLPTTRHV